MSCAGNPGPRCRASIPGSHRSASSTLRKVCLVASGARPQGAWPRRAPPPRRHIAANLDARLPHQLREALHALEALLRLLAPKVEDQLADAEPGVGRDVAFHRVIWRRPFGFAPGFRSPFPSSRDPSLSKLGAPETP